MIVVSDTGPLNYFALLGHLDVLPKLYGQVVIPTAVAEELSRPSSPQVVRALIQAPEPWFKTEKPPARDLGLADLGDGEQEAIMLVGTVGVLSAAADEGLLDLVDALSRLCRTNFRISKTLLKQILEQHRGTS